MSDLIPPPLTDADIQSHFPVEREKLPAATFELGLTLGGTVSAGAYTAGVLDYLMEALDAWTVAKAAANPAADVPLHNVFISNIAGTSGGAINGAVMVRAANFGFPHGPVANNPLYQTWVQGLTFQELLSTEATGDPGPDIMSLLHCGALDVKVDQVLQHNGPALGQNGSPAARTWLADPLRLAMMVGNITGVPYRIRMTGNATLAHEMIAHADHVRFALTIPGGTNVYDPTPRGLGLDPKQRKDEFPLAIPATNNWDHLGRAALATSAFPLALKSRPVIRPLAFLGYRVTVLSDANGKDTVRPLVPIWDRLAPYTAGDLTTSINVDGGTLNNEPVDITRKALAGQVAHNEREGEKANRAVLLIDPFSDPEKLGPKIPPSIGGLIGPVVNELVEQNRFKPEDVALAQDPNIFSRFLIAPVRTDAAGKTIEGSAAIATGGLGGFLGFLSRDFLEHDFRLGRANAYGFLHSHFAFPADNPIFAAWTDDQKAAQLVPNSDPLAPPMYRMIPLMAHLQASPPPRPAVWPVQTAMPAWLNKSLDARLDLLKNRILPDELPDNWLRKSLARTAINIFWALGGRTYVRDKVVTALRDAMKAQKLWAG